MKKSNRMAIALGVMGVCAGMAQASGSAAVATDTVVDLFGYSPSKTVVPSTQWRADGAKLNKTMLVAKASPADRGPKLYVHAGPEGAHFGVEQEFSTWSDLTAVFRPSRWANPVSEGGPLSWANYHAWSEAPGRTGKVLLGEVAVVGTTYVILDAYNNYKDDDGGNGNGGGNNGGEMPF